jgi:hypothetical protein
MTRLNLGCWQRIKFPVGDLCLSVDLLHNSSYRPHPQPLSPIWARGAISVTRKGVQLNSARGLVKGSETDELRVGDEGDGVMDGGRGTGQRR